MTDGKRRRLAEADQRIAECKRRIARQERAIQQLNQRGQETAWAKDILEALQSSLRAFEKHREWIVSQMEGRAMTAGLILKPSPLGWNQNDYDVVEDSVIVGRIFFLDAVGPVGRPWMWATGNNGQIRRATHGYEATREDAMAAFAKSWRAHQHALEPAHLRVLRVYCPFEFRQLARATLGKIGGDLLVGRIDQLSHHHALYVQLARHSFQDTPQRVNLADEIGMMLWRQMFRDVLALVRLMTVQSLVTFAGDIDRTGVHYRVVAKQYID